MQQAVEEGAAFDVNNYDKGGSGIYDELFPALPESTNTSHTPAAQGQWNNTVSKMRVGSSIITQVFRVPAEERRFDNNDSFGEKESVRTCQSIMKDTAAHIEMSISKDQSLTFLITGKHDSVLEARRKILTNFQTQANVTISIPKEHHGWILGKSGARLQQLEKETATKISLPNINDASDKIVVTGTREGIEKAVHEIRVISDEQSKKAFEVVTVPKCFHPFIYGAHNETLNNLMAQTGARINIPPPSVPKDDITIAGEKEGVAQAKERILQIYHDMEKRSATVSVEVPKTQHKYVIGQRGSGIAEILQKTGVSVEMPPSDSPTDTITLRGLHTQLGAALTMVYEKASSVQTETVDAPDWIHKYIIGRKGDNIKKLTQDLPKVHVEFTEHKIKIEGPPEEVKQAKEHFQSVTADLMNKLTYTTLQVDPKYFKHIIGKNGANVNRLKEQTDAVINITESNGNNIIRIEGNKAGVDQAKRELEEMINKLENEKEKDVIIDHRYYRSIIGSKGEKIREIREKFNQVQITVPNASEKHDIVKVRGPKEDVDKCHKYLLKLVKEINENSFILEVPIYKQYHKLIIGKGGANIRKIREETGTKIDLPSEGDKDEVILITGKKEKVEEARDLIMKIQNEQANIVCEDVTIPPKYYNSLIGSGGKLIRAIMDECGGVTIKFPSVESKSDKVTIRGPKDDVDRAKQQLIELANERQLHSYTTEVRAKPQHHRFLIGKNGANIKKLRESTGCKIVIPTSNDDDPELITIIGKQEDAVKAKAELEAIIQEIENVTEDEMVVEQKHHRHFVSRRGDVLNRIADDCGGVSISFPRSGDMSNRVVLKGSRECINAAKQRINEIVEELEAMVTIECVIPQKHHAKVMGTKGMKVQDIQSRYEVQIKFPDRNTQDDQGFGYMDGDVGNNLPNGDSSEAPTVRPCDVIRITGKPENCEAAKQALIDNVPITIEMNVPYDYHGSIIGPKGQSIRDLSRTYDVHIDVPSKNSDQHLDIIKITGTRENVENAKLAIEDKIKDIDAERQDRILKSFELKLTVDPEYHPKIIGKRGQVISKIRMDHNVQINFPRRGEEAENIITIIGYQENAEAACDTIKKIVKELDEKTKEEVFLDHRVHSRLIGTRGRSIRKIMEKYKVEIKFPRESDPDPNVVVVTGNEDNVLEAIDHLKNLEEEYLQDVEDAEWRASYQPGHNAARPDENENKNNVTSNSNSIGFVVKGAPWQQKAPDTASTEEFPSFGGGTGSTPQHSVRWGPPR